MDEIEYMFKVNTVGSIILSTKIAKIMKKSRKVLILEILRIYIRNLKSKFFYLSLNFLLHHFDLKK